jgi:hypothetical protein
MTTLAELLDCPASSSTSYLAELVKLPLESIIAEPTSLQTQSHHLTSSLTTLTLNSYPSLLSINDSVTALDESLQDLSSSLDSLLNNSLPYLQAVASAWKSRTENILRDRASARSVLDLHDKIRDLLDIPLLIQTCVRNGFYAEALSLETHVKSLTRSPNASPILLSVLADVHSAINQMLLSLLSTLQEPHRKLPALWKTVNFLRKMIHTEDTEQILALVFLTGREASFVSALHACARDVTTLMLALSSSEETGFTERDQEDLARYTKKHIDLWREGLHDIMTQYTTIFLEKQENKQVTHHLLCNYASHALSTHLLPILATVLPHLPTYLPSFLSQLTYCATAFARLGFDFQALLSSIFSDAALRVFQRQCGLTVNAFKKRITMASSRKEFPLPSQWLADRGAPPATLDKSAPLHVPPATLVSYPPLAELLNGLLTILNGLRQMAPVAIAGQLVKELERALAQCGEVLVGYLDHLTILSNPDEVVVARRVGSAYFDVLVVYVRSALLKGVYRHDSSAEVVKDSTLTQVLQGWEAWLEKTGTESDDEELDEGESDEGESGDTGSGESDSGDD